MAPLYLSGRYLVKASFVSYRWLSASKTMDSVMDQTLLAI
jgi:hypothetical protein